MTSTTLPLGVPDPMPITILGGGLAGLTLGRCLARHGIPSVIYEKSSQSYRRHGYSIALFPWAIKPLLKLLEIDEVKFRRGMQIGMKLTRAQKIVIAQQGIRRLTTRNPIHVNRKALEDMLATGLDIRWGYQIEAIGLQEDDGKQGLKLTFSNGETLSPSNIVVDALGVHSKLRTDLLPDTQLEVHPYVVYNGRRNINSQLFESTYAPAFNRALISPPLLVRDPERGSDTRLEISMTGKADFDRKTVHEDVGISYVYSRPARAKDPLFNASRSKDAASTVNDDLFSEIDTFMSSQHNIDPAFQDCFAVKEMRNDRLLNWLMRTVLVPKKDLNRLAQLGIVMLGDSAHAVPILGADGANLAIADAMRLSDLIAEPATSPQGTIPEFYDDRYKVWKKAVEDSKGRLAAMHEPASGTSASL